VQDETVRLFASRCSLTVAAVVLAATGPGITQAKGSYQFKTFNLDRSRYFSNYRSVVRRYLRQQSPRRAARACVIGLGGGVHDSLAWVIWRGGGRLILWEGEGENDLTRSRRYLSFKDDVVATDEAVGSSTYLVGRPWLNALERECARSGRVVAVK
jgi:hypothetical protein